MKVIKSKKIDALVKQLMREVVQEGDGPNIIDFLEGVAILSITDIGVIEVNDVIEAFHKGVKFASEESVVEIVINYDDFTFTWLVSGDVDSVFNKIKDWEKNR